MLAIQTNTAHYKLESRGLARKTVSRLEPAYKPTAASCVGCTCCLMRIAGVQHLRPTVRISASWYLLTMLVCFLYLLQQLVSRSILCACIAGPL